MIKLFNMRNNLFLNELFIFLISYKLISYRSSRLEVFCKKVVLWNFAKFTGKHLCQTLFFNKVGGLRLATSLKHTFSCEFLRNFKADLFYRTPLGDCFFSFWLYLYQVRHTRKVGPRPWGGTQDPGPWGGTLGWNPRVRQPHLFL